MLYSTRSKPDFSFISAALLAGTVSLIVGWHFLHGSILNKANNRIMQYLNITQLRYVTAKKKI